MSNPTPIGSGPAARPIPAPAPPEDSSSAPLERFGPTLSSEQIIAIGQLSRGESITTAARTAGVNRSTVHRWINDDPDFCATYHQWRAQLIESARSRVLAMADEAVTTVRGAIKGGNLHASLAVVKSLGILTPPRDGPTDAKAAAARIEAHRLQRHSKLTRRLRDAQSTAVFDPPIKLEPKAKPACDVEEDEDDESTTGLSGSSV